MLTIHDKPYSEVFELDKLVYLTADSPNVIEEIDHTKIYIVGGIVDHNRLKVLEIFVVISHLKHITLNKATAQNIATAQLPIGKYLHLNSRKVLTVNQIVEILLNYDVTKNWETAFLKTIPQRKLQVDAPNKTNTDDAEGATRDDLG